MSPIRYCSSVDKYNHCRDVLPAASSHAAHVLTRVRRLPCLTCERPFSKPQLRQLDCLLQW
jgi:hypothetical protein